MHERDECSMCCANTVGTATVKAAAGMPVYCPALAKVLQTWIEQAHLKQL